MLAVLVAAAPAHAQFQTPAGDTAQTYWNLQYPPVDFSAPVKMYAVTDSILYLLSDGFILRAATQASRFNRARCPADTV